MNKKKVIIISIITIVLLIGGSFAYWMLNVSQTTTNNIATSCFNISLSEDNAINLQNAFPMRDSEGASLTPYEFTITNNCSTYAYYEVNLEVLNTTNLNSEYIKIMLDDENPSLLSNKTVTTTTLSNASSSHRLKTAYLHASESKTYNLRLWLDENVTLADNVNEKEFSGKITIRATYKPDEPTQMEECELVYGEGAGVCNFIAQADPANNKCLHTDQNGMVTGDDSVLYDDIETPIVCAMEDDYGTSYYLRGLHTDNNVKFADSCWKIIRTTGTGGIKMIYNGDVDGNGTCTTSSGTHNGVTGEALLLDGNKVYGTSYTKEGNTYILSDTSTMNWSNDADGIIGKYTCKNTNTSCSTLYVVTGKASARYGYGVMLDQSTNYAQIGTSAFNYYNTSYNTTEDASLSLVGYMYNDTYPRKRIVFTTSEGPTILSSIRADTSNYYYGDTISYSNGYYYITNQDGSDVVQLDWANNYQTNLVGKYTCQETSKYNNTTIRCYTAYKVIDTTTKTNYMISEFLGGGRLAIGDIKLATSYSENNGVYELTGSVVTLSAMDWYNGYSNYGDYYMCGDYNQTTCNGIIQILSPQQTYIHYSDRSSNNYYYGNSFTYDDTNPTRPYTLTDTVQFWEYHDSNNNRSLNTHHYTCFRSQDNTCDRLYYIYNGSNGDFFYIMLNGNETISNALDKMLINDNINVKDSHIKGVIDWWYETNILGTANESKLEDTVFCNDRTIDQLNGWNETGNIYNYLYFNGAAFGSDKFYLKCPQRRDAFTVSDITNGNGSLDYPIGLLTMTEYILLGSYEARTTGSRYWASAPGDDIRGRIIFDDGGLSYSYDVKFDFGVRPSISLKPGTKFIEGGDGTASNPYEVDMTN